MPASFSHNSAGAAGKVTKPRSGNSSNAGQLSQQRAGKISSNDARLSQGRQRHKRRWRLWLDTGVDTVEDKLHHGGQLRVRALLVTHHPGKQIRVILGQ